MRNLIKKSREKFAKLPVHPSFLLLFLWFVFTGKWTEFFIFVGVVLTHEFAHYFVAKRLGYKLDSFFIAPYGVSLNFKESVFENNDEIKIALAGPLVNLLLAFLCIAFWWILPESYFYTKVFVVESLMLGLFNLLPAYPMDGGRVFLSFLSKFTLREKAIKVIKIFNIVFSVIFFILFLVSCAFNFNPTLALAGIFLILGIFESNFESKYRVASFFKKQNKSFSKVFELYASSQDSLGQFLKHIQQNRYTIFYVDFKDGTKVIDEKIVLQLSLLFPLNMTMEEIYNKKHAKRV